MTTVSFLTYITLYHISSTNYAPQKPSLLLKQFNNKMSDIADQASRRSLITAGFEWEPQDIQDMLDAHNIFRAETANGATPAPGGTQPTAANMNKLFWDPALEKVATDYATTCPGVAHNSNRVSDLKAAESLATFIYMSNSRVGENIYLSGLKTPVMNYMWGNNNYGILGSIDMWADEAEHYSYDDGSCDGDVCGHYTQVVWANTRYVGCGISKCQGHNYPTFVVCNYWPAGNWANQKAYITGTPCSKCQKDRVLCENGLCAGGMSSGFLASGDINVDQCDDGTGRNQCRHIDTTEIPTERPSDTTEYPSDTQLSGMIKSYSGLCLTIISDDNGSPVELLTCNSMLKSQKFYLVYNELKNVNGKCVEIDENKFDDIGAPLQIMECDGGVNQYWKLDYNWLPDNSGRARILASNSRCLTASNTKPLLSICEMDAETMWADTPQRWSLYAN